MEESKAFPCRRSHISDVNQIFFFSKIVRTLPLSLSVFQNIILSCCFLDPFLLVEICVEERDKPCKLFMNLYLFSEFLFSCT